jgi:serine/threonine protein phosphatase 1
MISALFRTNKARASGPAPASVPSGTIVWAVGDVHGCLALLQALTSAIISDASESLAERKVVVFLGDYIDRGPDSRGVIQHLQALPKDIGIEWRFLKGNHEEAMLRFLADPGFGSNWCDYGGDAALLSYGLRPPAMRHRADAWARLAADLDHKLSLDEREFLDQLELSLVVGDYFFAHAGARPGRSLEAQSAEDLLWIRRSFLDSAQTFSKVIVHGHTPTEAVHSDHRRVGVDTKAYESGVLSALRLEGQSRSVVQSATTGEGEPATISRYQI